MTVMTVPRQRDRRSQLPAPVLRIESASPLGAQLLVPAQRSDERIAPLLPIQRRALRPAPTRALLRVVVTGGFALGVWLAVVGAVVGLGRTL
jgi:hypothetical protein